jgi:REP element-mobilizing transposase RayT
MSALLRGKCGTFPLATDRVDRMSGYSIGDHGGGSPDRNVRVTVPFRPFDEYGDLEIRVRHMPHWTQPGATYFLTFRLGDAVPLSLREQWREERELWLRFHPEPWSAKSETEYRARFADRMDGWLDAGHGECHLRRPELRAEVTRCLCLFDAERLDLDAFVIMPNHVHAILTPRPGHDLFRLLKGIKGASARACNLLLGRTGETFWMEDAYNRIVRDAEELAAFRDYIAENPAKAKLRSEEFTLAMNGVLVT